MTLRITIPLLALMAAGSSLLAETTAHPDSTAPRRYVLDTVHVVADTPLETVGMVSRVIIADIAGGGINIRDGLQDIPGINNTQGTKDESNLRLRGFRKNEVKVLIDGRPLNSGYFGNVDLNSLALGDISEALIVKGPASSIYGSGSMGGVVNLLRRTPDNKSWVILEALFKRNATYSLALKSAHRFRFWSYRIQAARDYSEGMVLSGNFQPTPFENGGVRDNNDKAQLSVDGGIDFYPSDFHRVGITGGYSYMQDKPIPTSVYEMGYRMYKNWKRYQATAVWEGILSGSLGGNAMLYLDGGGDRYLEYNDAAHQSLSLDSEMRYFSLGLNPRFELRAWDNAVLHLGARLENSFSTRKDNGSYPDWTSHRLGTYNLFAHYTRNLAPNLSLSAGMGASANENDLRTKLQLFLEPTIGLNLKHSSGASSNLAIGRGTAFPTMRQLFSSERGNPDLLPQSAIKVEATHYQPFRLWSLQPAIELSVYYNHARDLIDLQNGRYENIYRVDSYGAEASLGFSPLSALHTEISYALLRYSSSSDYRLTETPRNSVDVVHRLSLPLAVTARLASHWKDIRYSEDALYNYRALPSYWKHDISLSRAWKRIEASLGLENILDANYFTEYGYPAAGLNFFLKLKASL